MCNRFILSIFSLLFLTTLAHAGKIVLEAILFAEQKGAMKRTFVDPYNQDTTNTAPDGATSRTCFSPPSHSDTKISYPSLTDLKHMRYVTILISNIGENDAKTLAEKYTKGIQAIDLHEILVIPDNNAVVYKYQPTHVEMAIVVTPADLEGLNKVTAATYSVKEGCECTLRNYGHIVFGAATPSHGKTFSHQIIAMTQKINDLSSVLEPLNLKFNKFNLKYINDKEEVVFIHPLNLN